MTSVLEITSEGNQNKRRYCKNMHVYLDEAEKRGFTVLDLAKICEVDPSTVSRWLKLKDKGYSSVAPARKLKAYLDGVSPTINQPVPVEDRNSQIEKWLEEGKRLGLSVHILAIK